MGERRLEVGLESGEGPVQGRGEGVDEGERAGLSGEENGGGGEVGGRR